ncbi:hypothetical protein M569_08832, partial [Genlisea aurea]
MGDRYKCLKIKRKSPESGVFHLIMNRPSRGNALSREFFSEFLEALRELDFSSQTGVIVLSGLGNHFCSGIDLKTLIPTEEGTPGSSDVGRTAEKLRREIKFLQQAITAIEQCRKPVIAAIHGACIGGGIDIITACDLRYASESAFFSVKEVELGLAADLGTLQRLPSIVGLGNAMELALTARKFTAQEAKELGLISRVFPTQETLIAGVEEVAEHICGLSPVAVIGTKRVILESRDLSLDQGLDYVATWNSAALQSDDLKEAVSAQLHKRKPSF